MTPDQNYLPEYKEAVGEARKTARKSGNILSRSQRYSRVLHSLRSEISISFLLLVFTFNEADRCKVTTPVRREPTLTQSAEAPRSDDLAGIYGDLLDRKDGIKMVAARVDTKPPEAILLTTASAHKNWLVSFGETTWHGLQSS